MIKEQDQSKETFPYTKAHAYIGVNASCIIIVQTE